MNPLDILKLTVSVALLAALGYSVWNYGHLKEENAMLHAVIEQADAQAHANQIIYKENHDAIESDVTVRESAIRKYYRGLLLARDQVAASKDAERTARLDEPAAESCTGETERSYEFEQQCVETASRLVGWQDWARLNRIPVD
jgi:hypothetical protein